MKKITMKKRIASLALAMAMLLSYIPGAVWAVDSGTDIKAIEKPTGLSIVEDYDDYFGDGWESKLELPASVTVTLANGTTVQAPVTWDTSVLDPRTPGYYFLPGDVTLPAEATNGQNLEVTITVQVREYANLITLGGFNSGVKSDITKDIYVAGTHSQVDSPVKEGSHAAKTFTGWTSWGNVAYNKNTADIATAVNQLGAGQYYFGVWGRSEDNEAMKIKANLLYKTPASTSSITTAGTQVTLNNTEFVASSGIATLPEDVTYIQMQVRLDRYSSSGSLNGKVLYLDLAEIIALKVPLKVEPANIAEIKTEIPSRFVAVNYDKYVGENWKEALGLPSSVEVVTDKGTVGSVGVTWNYGALDVSKCGKYTLTGTLDAGGFPNPKGLTVTQNIYVRKADNLISNPSFEEGANGWGWGNHFEINGTPAAEGKFAFWVRSSKSNSSSYNMMFVNGSEQTALADRVAATGAGQYYFGAQVMDALYKDEVAHTDELSVFIELLYKTDRGVSNSSLKGQTARVTISDKGYTSVGGVFNMTGEEVWFRNDLYMTSSTKFNTQWILVDEMQCIPLNVLIPKGEEPADIAEVTEEIPVRAVVQNYDKYVGANWQEALGLPATVEVKTSKGLSASVAVTWDYTPLNLNKVGKYTLVGTLDNSLYPNPENLYVTQVIYVREYKNLLSNGSFESGVTDWGWGSSYKTNLTPAFDGKYAVGVKSSSNSYASYHIFFSMDTAALAAKVVEEGAGQYYLSAQLRDHKESSEVTHTDPLRMHMDVGTRPTSDGPTTTKGTTNTIVVNNSYQQVSSTFNLNGDEAWMRLNFYMTSDSKFADQWIMIDKVELVPLSVTVQTYEGAAEEVQTIIPARKIIQNYPNYVEGYTTADLLFPETVEVRSTLGEIVKVGVKWDYSKLDLTKLGTYTLTGVLDDMKLANPNGITVDQVVHIVSYQNLLMDGGFEDGTNRWGSSGQLSSMNVATPKIEGDYSLEVTMGKMENYVSDGNTKKDTYLQAFYSGSQQTIGQRITQTGAGRYYFGVNIQGHTSATDLTFQTRFLYKNVANGDSSISVNGSTLPVITNKFSQSSGIITVPGDVTWTRLDIYYFGSVEQLRLSTLWMDKAEIVPINVEVPNMNDIIYCEPTANIYVHEGTSAAGLKLPEKLEILLKNTQRFDLPVKWDTSHYEPNKIGEQTITGSLVIGDKYKNTQNFIPTIKIIVRAKGEDLRQTIYISTSGSEENDGLSPNSPKLEVKNIPTYLRQGYNVRLKRGDTWYLPSSGISLSNIRGTADVPVVLGAYGSGDELPTIAYMLKIENSEWKLVDAKRNVYAVDVSSLGQRNGENVHRCFVNDEAYTHKARNNYVTLDPGWYCNYDGKLYIRMPEGEVPNNVEVTPYGSGGTRLTVTEVSHLTIEYIHFKGSSAINGMMRFNAPTEHVKFQYCSITHCFYYIMVFEASDERDHYKPEISHCYIDAMFNKEEGAKNYDGHWNVGITEGITMRDGVDGAWIHHNHIRNMSHAFIAIESLDRQNDSKTRGVRNCYIEDNVLEGANALYARAFNINGGWNLSGIQMCHDNTWRRNRCYDMTTSSHLFGENNLVYSNLFSYVHCEYNEEGELFDGKSAQPYGFDVLTYGEHGCVGNILVNNTFYDVSSAVAIIDKGTAVYNSIFANNLIVNWTSDPGAVSGTAGAIHDTTAGQIYVMNNGLYAPGRVDHFVVDGKIYSVDDANTQIPGYSGNIFADPKFVNFDFNLTGKEVRQDFTLSGDSPFRYAGLSINSSVYEGYSAYERLKAEYTDLNGTPFLAESPSIGAISYSELIKGEVASTSKLEDIVARTGAKLEQLNLPDTVTAKNDQGIDVVLLIIWDEAGFDSSKPGTITLTGQLRNGPHTDLNVEGKTVSINIQIKDKLELLSIATEVKGITIFYNTSLEDAIAQLPKTLTVVTETGFEEELPVTWTCDDYNPTVPDVYTFKCILPAELITNPEEFRIEVEVRVLHEVGRGMELLINPDFIDGTSAAPWKFGWGTGTFKVTQDPELLYPGEPASAIVTAEGRYGSLQQDVTGQVKLLGDGKYLFRCYMRSYLPHVPVDSSYACVQVVGKTEDAYRCRAKVNIGENWVEYTAVMDIDKVAEATTITFHTSTGKTKEDAEKKKSYVISGCSFIFLGTTDEEVEATLDSIGLEWNTIKGENGYDMNNVTSDLTLPGTIGEASKISWTSSDESAITSDGKVTMGRLPKRVVLTANITYKNGIVTTKKFTVTVPRDPALPIYTASLSGNQTTVKPGDEFSVVISVDSKNATAYNAYRFTLSFTKSKLEFVGISDPNATVELDGGKLVIYGIGTERPITDTITVTFRALKSGVTDVKLVKVEMDNDPNADLNALPTMEVANRDATITVEKEDVGDGTDKNDPDADTNSKGDRENKVTIYILVGIAVAILACCGVIAWILIKKKKQTPPTEE